MRTKIKRPESNKPKSTTGYFFPKVQPKLAIGEPGDSYEVEADQIADQVVGKSSTVNTVQKMDGEEEVQQKPLAASVTPLVQKKEDEEDAVQSKLESTPATNTTIEGKLQNGSGGSKMDVTTQTEMEAGFGADFRKVNIHTNSEAVQMNKSIGAQAFTHGNDVYFNSGKYNPTSNSGKHLLAHELTHTIQQGAAPIQRKVENKSIHKTAYNLQGGFFGNLWKGIKNVGKSVANFVTSGVNTVTNYVTSGVNAVGDVLGSAWKTATTFLGDTATWAWNGIKSLGTDALEWLKNAGSQVWDAIKWFGDKSWEIIKNIGSSLWEKLSLLGTNAWSIISKFPARLWGFVIQGWNGIKGLANWAWDSLKSGAEWAGTLLMKLFDVVGAGEALQLIWGLVFKMRKLTPEEIEASQRVHPPGMIPYDLIRIDENSLISMIGGAAVTTFHIIHLPKGGIDLDVMVHELTHVAQYEKVGSVYMPQAIHAQLSWGRAGRGSAYDYERTGTLADQRAAGKKFKDLNRESQAQLVQDYYKLLINVGNTADYLPFINDMRNGEF